AITRFFLIRALVLIVLDLTVCQWFWRGQGPYLHVLLSIGSAMAILALLRLAGPRWVLAVGLVLLVLYQALIGPIADRFSQSTNFATAFLLGYSTQIWPAVEFSILGWFGLLAIGYGIGPWLATARAKEPRTWLIVSAVLLGGWCLLRLAGGFGDLVPFQSGQSLHLFLIMGKTPPTLTYFAFNLGIAALLLALMWANLRSLDSAPWRWLVSMGQVALFLYVAHIVIYSLLALLAPTRWFDGSSMPALVPAVALWAVGLSILAPLCVAYRRLKQTHPDSVLRFL
ncbi:MAG: DUF1624 domain-containing protein, partial [Caldilineaceae bacterium]